MEVENLLFAEEHDVSSGHPIPFHDCWREGNENESCCVGRAAENSRKVDKARVYMNVQTQVPIVQDILSRGCLNLSLPSVQLRGQQRHLLKGYQ